MSITPQGIVLIVLLVTTLFMPVTIISYIVWSITLIVILLKFESWHRTKSCRHFTPQRKKNKQ